MPIENIIKVAVKVSRPYYKPTMIHEFKLYEVRADETEYYLLKWTVRARSIDRTLLEHTTDSLFIAKALMLTWVTRYIQGVSVVGGLDITIMSTSKEFEDLVEELKGVIELSIIQKPLYRALKPPVDIKVVRTYE